MTSFMSLTRITDSLLGRELVRNVQHSLRGLAEGERAISSGRRFSAPSDAPLSVRRIIAWERLVERNEKYHQNIELSSSRLAASETSLDEMGNLIIRAREIALSQLNATANDETRQSASLEISNLLDTSLALANRQFGDRFLFGGSRVTETPFERVGNFVVYRGDDEESQSEIARGMTLGSSVTGVQAFSAFSAEVIGRDDLDPHIAVDTPLTVLNNGRGVSTGTIEIRDGSGESAFFDLSQAKTVGDIINTVNENGFVTAGLTPDRTGFTFSKAGGNLTVLDVNGGSTAADLGVQAANMGSSFTGTDLDPRIVATTPLSFLRGGNGIDNAGFTIRNGNLSATIDTSGATTVEDLVNLVESSGTNTFARISADGRGVDIVSRMSGADLFIDEGGGDTASELGLLIPLGEVPLERLNAGLGVGRIEGHDFRITLRDATTLDVDISSAVTLGDVVDLVNDDPSNGGLLVASVDSSGRRLILEDQTTGSGDLIVSPLNGSFAAAGLGIFQTVSANLLTGADLNPGGVRVNSVFDGFAMLHQGLVDSDESMLQRALDTLQAAETQALEARADIGGRIRRLELSGRRTELETLEVRGLISEEGDTDLAEAIVKFQRDETAYQAALQTSSRLLGLSILDFLG